MAEPFVREEIRGPIGIAWVNNPPVNALSPGVPDAILETLTDFASRSEIQAAVLIGDGSTFVVGADINELQRIANGQASFDDALQSFLDKLESLKLPIVAAIHGAALGGGLELAMACHFRIADSKASLGQPEVNLGLIPGAAGTQRLPRLVGITKAAEMCALGKPIDAQISCELGLVDAVSSESLLEDAVAFAKQFLAEEREFTRTSSRTDRLQWNQSVENEIEALRKSVEQERPSEVAPRIAIDAVVATNALPFAEGCREELRLFDQCMNGPQARAMIRAFFGSRKLEARPNRGEATHQIGHCLLIGSNQSAQDWSVLLTKKGIKSTTLDTVDDQQIDELIKQAVENEHWLVFRDSVSFDGKLGRGDSPSEEPVSSSSFEAQAAFHVEVTTPNEIQSLREDVEAWPHQVSLVTSARPKCVELWCESRDEHADRNSIITFLKTHSLGPVVRHGQSKPVWIRLHQAIERAGRFAIARGHASAEVIHASRQLMRSKSFELVMNDDDNLKSSDDDLGGLGDDTRRLIYDSLTCEAALLLSERELATAELIDMLVLRELDFPSYLGGPLWSAEQECLDVVHSRLQVYRSIDPAGWPLADAWPFWCDEGRFVAT